MKKYLRLPILMIVLNGCVFGNIPDPEYSPFSSNRILEVTPRIGPVSGGTDITISGRYFSQNTRVQVDGNDCLGIVFVSDEEITCRTPPGTAGDVSIVLIDSTYGRAVMNPGFYYLNPPDVGSISPISGDVGGGTEVIIDGRDFYSQGIRVSIGGADCNNPILESSSRLRCTIGPGATAGAADIVITNSDGQSDTLANGFTYLTSPVIASVIPNEGPASGGTTISIAGSGFLNNTIVSLGGTPCTVTNSTPTAITCTTNPHPGGSVAVTLNLPNQQSISRPSAFTYRPAPTISSITPSFGIPSGGENIIIRGDGFYTGATVIFDTNPCTSVVVNSNTELTCTSPAHSSGLVSVRVENSDGQFIVENNRFNYLSPPVITGIVPTGGSPNGNTSVVITGSGFFQGAIIQIDPGATQALCLPTSLSATQIICTTGIHIPGGPYDIRVINPDGQTNTLSAIYTYQNPPNILSVFPTVANPAGGGDIDYPGE